MGGKVVNSQLVTLNDMTQSAVGSGHWHKNLPYVKKT